MAIKPATVSTNAPEAPAIVALPEVVAGIKKAERAAGTMLAETREAARKAAEQLNPALPIGERIEQVMACYASALAGVNHNIKAIFKDVITLKAAESCPVSVDVIGKDGKKVEAHIAAAEAVDLPKHSLRAAAQEVREVHGMARKRVNKPKAAAPAGEPAPDMQPTAVEKFNAWLADMDEYLTDSVLHPQIVAHLATIGYTLGKAVKGRVVRGKAAA